ncbi:MAG TPA: serine hydrolase [Burkholderiales bacterium]|nr:serine hydrolase [Burkholderiales bacterium]
MTSRIAACALVLLAALPPAAHGLDLRPQIDPLARPLLEDGLVVGLVVGIVQDGQTQVIAYGETAKGSGIAPRGDTVYEIGSISKVFTSVLLASMVLEGRMKLDDPVQKYLPASVRVPVANGTPITLEHLATQSSGLPRMPDNFAPADASNPYADYSVAEMYAFLNGHALRRPPGRYEYSNYAMGLLGHVLALQAGETYEELLIERIAAPLGMRDTRVTLDVGQRRRLAPPYDASLRPERNWDFQALVGAGGIRSTCDDLLRFVEANLAADGQPLAQALQLAQRKRDAVKGGPAMGLGWHIAEDGVSLWHNGMTGGYHGWIAVAPGRGVGVVVLANTATMRVSELGNQVARVALGLDAAPLRRHRAIDVDPAVLAPFAGSYAVTPKFILTVTVEDGKLMVQATGQEKFQVFAESKTEYFYKVVDAQISFVPGSDGKTDKLILHQGGRDLEAVRQE